MGAMLHVLSHDILPVFAILALGFGMGSFKTASEPEARALNRIAFLVLQPALIFPLIAGIDLGGFDFRALAVYALCEAVAFTLAYAIARIVFGRAHLESWLLAMAVVFVNSLLYIWPISFLIYGEAAALPITAIVAWDSSFSFAFFIVTTDLMSGSSSRGAAMKRVARNPVLIAIALGMAMNAFHIPVPDPVLTAAKFAGAGAAPLTLFALGVILSQQSIRPTGTVAGISALKLIFFPLLVWTALGLFAPGTDWRALFTLNAAGPSGAMSFALALLYGVRTDTIAPVVIWTSVLSLFSLAILA